ncbi:hypothetical protein BHE74_00017686 [Ensete ventricosum]|nr:hypothetical protein GW17_00009796 [Ensete ventricosum]RWW74373.1 hypothetical protein BHE74_00017686 [Ensete ventricosum]RZR84051.1 hypothetical protein BHM03_00010790 [Ensete ventricosum]
MRSVTMASSVEVPQSFQSLDGIRTLAESGRFKISAVYSWYRAVPNILVLYRIGIYRPYRAVWYGIGNPANYISERYDTVIFNIHEFS